MSSTQKFITMPQFMPLSLHELHLLHIKSQKLNLMRKTKVPLDHGGGRRCTPNTFWNFVDHVTIFNLNSMQHLR